MKNLKGFPVELGGVKKYEKYDLAWNNGDLQIASGNVQTVRGTDALAQQIEYAVLSLSEEDRSSPEGVAKAMMPAIRENLAEHLERIVAVRAEGREMEIEFVAAGYPGSHTKRLNLDGRGGLPK